MKKSLIALSIILALAIQSGRSYAENSTDDGKTVDRKEGIRRRTAEDRKNYSTEQLREIENLYQVANKLWKTPRLRQALKFS